MTTYGATSDNKVVKLTIFFFSHKVHTDLSFSVILLRLKHWIELEKLSFTPMFYIQFIYKYFCDDFISETSLYI